jgi:hypothetical protein
VLLGGHARSDAGLISETRGYEINVNYFFCSNPVIQPPPVRVLVGIGQPPYQTRELRTMEPTKSVDIEQKRIEQKYDKGLVASTFIKYAAYIIIIFGLLYFLVRFVFPLF